MEFRWKSSAHGNLGDDRLGGQPKWLDYVRHLSEIGALGQIPTELVAEEYRIRQLWGDRPSHDHFISAFPTQIAHLPNWLARVDEELRADGAIETASEPSSPASSTAPDPRAPLPWSDYVLHELLVEDVVGTFYPGCKELGIRLEHHRRVLSLVIHLLNLTLRMHTQCTASLDYR